MACSLRPTGVAVSLQHDSQYLGRSRGSMDRDKHNPETNCDSAVGESSDTTNHASYHRSFQSGLDSADSLSHCVRRETISCSSSYAQEEVSKKNIVRIHILTSVRRFNALHNVHTAETFPLALASGAVLQQIIFVAVQSTSLHSVLSTQCRGLAMVTFPGM